MDTNRIKRFATEARNKLKEGIAAKIRTLGFDKKGNVAEEHRPQLMQGGTHWNGQLLPETFYHQWTSLYNRIQLKGISEVYEEAAYTWFNRLCAIRILQKNDLCAPVIDYTDAARTPFIVDEARQGRIPEMNNEMRSRMSDLLDDDTKVTEQFAVLINAWCHDNPIIHRCFGAMADYTELLLPNNILTEGGFMDMLNHTDFITDADYRSPELIGWLYQFYISERKDEVFAKKGKFEADEIPAATQIFTPNWIVKYMVQNTVGRIYLDNNPYETQLQKKWQYLVEPSEKPSADSILKYEELTDLRVADLACGSGHILNECFDLLYDLYIAEGYGRGEAIENIFLHNLTGVDLDTRAKQLATFALLLKACQKDNAFADAHCLSNVLDMTGIVPDMNEQELSEASLRFMGGYENVAGEMLEQDFELLRDADNLGSIMKFNDDEDYLAMLRYHYDDWTEGGIDDCPEDIKVLIPGVRLILALTDKYHALVMNPPYMGSGNMNATLSKYVKCNYEEGKADLATVFVQMMADRTLKNGSYAFIIPPSWMFLSTFENLRKNIIENNTIQSLFHLSRGVFGADFGASSAVIQNAANKEARGTYFRLVERTFQEFEQSHLRMLFEQTLANHDFKYRFKDYTKEVTELPYSEDGNRIYYPNVSQQDFEKIPGIRFAFWLSKTIIESFGKNKIKEIACPKAGLSTGDNDRFLRFWFEVTIENIYFDGKCRNDLTSFTEKWVPMTKGGSFRKWYGNNEYILNFQNDGAELKYWLVNNPNDPSTKSFSRYIRNYDLYCKSGFSFADVNSGNTNFRFQPTGFIPNARGPFIFSEERCLLGYLNSCIPNIILKALSPTMSYNVGDVGLVPYISVDNISISNLVQQNISISKEDWDAHETSWDFETNPLLAVDNDTYIDNIHHEIERHEKETGEYLCIDPAMPELDSLKWRMEQYKQKWEHIFMQLHENEEELNRQFINIYGLQDELTPDVPLDEITILQQGEIKITDQYELSDSDGSVFADSDGAVLTTTGDLYLDWQNDVVMKQFISYAIGCMMGRYLLNKKGLHIAHPNPTAVETAPYIYNKVEFEIDEDGIIPLMPNDCGFSDNASNRFADFVRIALGDEKHVENLNFVEKCLGKSVEQYFVKDFWKDHKKMYQNRPIYWLFASKKGAFQCIAYMHRMNAYTAERIRAKYLLPYIETLQARITDLDARRSELTTRETKQLQQLTKTLEECQEYHDRLQVVAEQAIAFDLDDGVVVNYAKFGDVVQKIK
ncbi:BREX-1 system adenine-specific DNA-methyltransferase PglX [uncultured Bacteroides sp.]|uniref:BREX-1 system adenine-specific DNA-methyltransferase PglX n=1 Tax=uncultured Bacteroides sp. TaxID=162156 RepID=UPI0026034FC3|nr:BREX-1 system adenine-specific DNA-methyltransferase PglX [uncultured Bacteroides sp.]